MPVESVLGAAFLVNSVTQGSQYNPTITGLASGGFVVSWVDLSGIGVDSSQGAIKAQIFAPDGSPVGGEFLVNTVTDGYQDEPTITSLEGGGFVVSWVDFSAGDYGDIKAQIFSADGSPVGGEFRVNTATFGAQQQPTITALVGGGFVVCWAEIRGPSRTDPNPLGLKAQIFAADGSPVGGDFLVNTVMFGHQHFPTIAGLEGGGFVVSWADDSGIGGDSEGYGIKAQICAADGSPVGGEFLVNTATAGSQYDPTITGLEGGGFVVCWGGNNAQIFAADGSRVGGEFLVSAQFETSITGLMGGGFIAHWIDNNSEIKAQIFAADGSPVGGEFLVNTMTAGDQDQRTIIALAGGELVVCWRSVSDTNIYAQIFGTETLFTSADDVVDFNTLSLEQAQQIDEGVAIYDALGGNDTVILPNIAQWQLIDWDSAEVFHGGAGNDDITGGDGADKLDGGLNADFLAGGKGNDDLNGGPGDDNFQGVDWDHTSAIETGVNHIDGGDWGPDVWNIVDYRYARAHYDLHIVPPGPGDGQGFTIEVRNMGSDSDYIINWTQLDFAGDVQILEAPLAGAGVVAFALWSLRPAFEAIHDFVGKIEEFLGGENAAKYPYAVKFLKWYDVIEKLVDVAANAGVDVNSGEYRSALKVAVDQAVKEITNPIIDEASNRMKEFLEGVPDGPLKTQMMSYIDDGTRDLQSCIVEATNLVMDAAIDGAVSLTTIDWPATWNGWMDAVQSRITDLYRETPGMDDPATEFDDPHLQPLVPDAPEIQTPNSPPSDARTIILGSAGNDFSIPGDGINMFFGLAGNDIAIAAHGNGDDLYDGGSGIDSIRFLSAQLPLTINLATGVADGAEIGHDIVLRFENVVGGTGSDSITGSAGADNLSGNDGDDAIAGGLGADRLFGNAGNDTLDGGVGGGEDKMFGGTGDDIYVVDVSGDATVELAGEGTDLTRSSISHTLKANIENLELTGTAITGTGNALGNVITGNASVNRLYGLAGDDSFDGGGGGGEDKFYGGSGNDTYIVDSNGDATVELLNEGTDLVQSSVTHTLKANVENLILAGNLSSFGTGNALANIMTGNSGANRLIGKDGNDQLFGNAGVDRLYGDNGNDLIHGGSGEDKLYGGAGDDTYIIDSNGDATVELVGEGTDLVQSSVSHVLKANIENLELTGSTNLNGTGNGLANVLTGNSGANQLSGLAGNDVLDGGGGRDTLTGGTGADAFLFDDGDFAGLTTATCDLIGDFSQADGDTIRLDLVDANSGLAGDQAFTFINGAAFSNTAGQLRYEQIDGNTYVTGDTNGDSIADFMIRLDGLHTLQSADLLQIDGNAYAQRDTNGDNIADFLIRLDRLHTLTSGDFML